MTSILIVRTSAIGDVIQTLPVLEYLRRRFPDAKIDWVVEKAIAPLLEQMEGNLINRILPLETKKWAKAIYSVHTLREIGQFCNALRAVEYDYLFDLQGNIKSGCVTMAARAKHKIGYGRNSVREKPNLLATSIRHEFPLDLNIRQKYLGLPQKHFNDTAPFVSEGISFRLKPEEKKRLEQMMENSAPGIKLMIAMGSKWGNKRLDEETLKVFLSRVVSSCDPSFLFIYGSPEEKLVADRLTSTFSDRSQSVGDLSLPLWHSLMQRVDGVIAVDSAALHLAGTTQTPTFSVFGPTTPAVFKPIGERHHAIQGACPYGRTFVKQCPILRTCPTGACIRKLNPEILFESFIQWKDLL